MVTSKPPSLKGGFQTRESSIPGIRKGHKKAVRDLTSHIVAVPKVFIVIGHLVSPEPPEHSRIS